MKEEDKEIDEAVKKNQEHKQVKNVDTDNVSKDSEKSNGMELDVENEDFYTSNGYYHFSGKIVNNSSTKSYKYIKIKIIYYDTNDEIITTDWTYVIDSLPLEPGEKRNFEMTTKQDGLVEKYSYSFLED